MSKYINNLSVIHGYLTMMNQYEIAILRILLKSHSTLKVSQIVNGFPDDSKDDVVLAIYNLVDLGYISTAETPSGVYTSLKKEKRKEVMDIISPRMSEEQQKSSSSLPARSQLIPSLAAPSSTSTTTTFMVVGIIGICAAATVAITISMFMMHHVSLASPPPPLPQHQEMIQVTPRAAVELSAPPSGQAFAEPLVIIR